MTQKAKLAAFTLPLEVLTANYEDRIFKLDSFYTIIKIALLNFYPENTKISIHNNEIFLQEPDILQPFVRYYFKDSKNDLHNLKDPIKSACIKYLSSNTLVIFNNALGGLQKLMMTYKSYKIIADSIESYSAIISDSITSLKTLDTHIIYKTDGDKQKEIFENSWNIYLLNIVINFFNELNNKDSKCNKKKLIDSINQLLNSILI